jgi:hypothetical protein
MIEAADICTLIISKINGGDIHTYGSEPEDTILIPSPTRTVTLVTDCEWPRWFEITVTEVNPKNDRTGLRFDPEILSALVNRADERMDKTVRPSE